MKPIKLSSLNSGSTVIKGLKRLLPKPAVKASGFKIASFYIISVKSLFKRSLVANLTSFDF
ncbi:MAG: hypothetical protein WA076_06600, partial [Lactococcus raffinolactis]